MCLVELVERRHLSQCLIACILHPIVEVATQWIKRAPVLSVVVKLHGFPAASDDITYELSVYPLFVVVFYKEVKVLD